jgi:signal recognition particle receptor subunit beta
MFKAAETTTAQLLNESKLVSDLEKPLVPSVVFINHVDLSVSLPPEEAGYAFPDGFVRNQTDNHTNRKGEEA